MQGCIVVARASWCGRTSRSTTRASTPWRASSEAAKSPEGPAPMIKTSFRTSVTAGSQPPGMGVWQTTNMTDVERSGRQAGRLTVPTHASFLTLRPACPFYN